MSQRGKRGNRLESDSSIIQQPPVKRRKGRPTNSNSYNNGSGGSNGNGSSNNGGNTVSNTVQNTFYDGANVDAYNFDKVSSHIGATNLSGPTGACPVVSASNFVVPSTSKAQGSGGGTGGGSSSSTQWHARAIGDLKSSSIYNRSSSEAPAELFRKDLISAMKLPDSEPLSTDEYWLITDQWKQEWEKGVQVPVNPDSLPEPSVKYIPDYSLIVPQNHDFRPPKNKYVRITKDDSFSPELHYLSNVPTRAESVCSYDLDQTDECWLQIVNKERILSGAEPILDSQFERVVEELEMRCWDKIHAIMKTEEGLGIEYDENVICDVCRSPDSEEANEMVFCDNCNICVHQACYGITTIPSGQWLCRTCNMGKKPECVLCPNKGGAMKSTKSGKKWAHVSCALWIPEVSIGCVDRMEPITKISSIPQSRWALLCVLCRERVGACIQCSVKTCKTAYHVTCAFQHGLEMRAIIEEGNAEDGVKLRSYCLKHSVGKGKKDNKNNTNNGVSGNNSETEDDDCRRSRKVRKDMTTEERNQVRAQRLQEVEAEFDKHVNVKDISCHVHDIDQDAITYIYYYWILKRKQNYNRALIPAKSEDVEILSNKQDEEEAEQRRKVVHLRQDLERVRNLCYMVNRREKLSRSYFKTSEQIFYKQTAILSTLLNKDSSNTNNVINNNSNNVNSVNSNQNQSGNNISNNSSNNVNNVNNVINSNNNDNNNNDNNNSNNNINNINNNMNNAINDSSISNNNSMNNNNVNNSCNVSSDESFINAVLHANNGPSAYDKFYSSDVNVFGDPPNSQYNLEDILTTLVSRIDTSVSSLKNTHNSDNKKIGKGNNSISTANAVNSGISSSIGKANKTAAIGVSDISEEVTIAKGNKGRLGKMPYKKLQLNGMADRKKRASGLPSNKGETPSAVDCICSSDTSSSDSSSSNSDDSGGSSTSSGSSSSTTSSVPSPEKEVISNSNKKTMIATGTQRPNRITNKNTSKNLTNCNKRQTYARTQSQKQQQKRNNKKQDLTVAGSSEDEQNVLEPNKKKVTTNKSTNKKTATEITEPASNSKKNLLLQQMEKEFAKDYNSDSSNESEELLPIKHRTSAPVTGADTRSKTVNKKVPIYSDTDSEESSSDDDSDDSSQRDSSKGDNDGSSVSDATSTSDKEKEVDNTVIDSQHQMFRTKAAMKEFNLQSAAANKIIKPNSIEPKLNRKAVSEKNKSMTSLSSSDLNSSIEVSTSPAKSLNKSSKITTTNQSQKLKNEKDKSFVSAKEQNKKPSREQNKKSNIKTAKQHSTAIKPQHTETKINQISKAPKNFPTDLLVVPQRQAAKKASENMRSNNVYSAMATASSAVGGRKDSRDSRFDEKEVISDRVPPLPSPVNNIKTVKDQTNESSVTKDSKESKEDNESKKLLEKETKDKIISKDKTDVSSTKERDKRNEIRERTSKRGRPPKTAKDEVNKELLQNSSKENSHAKDQVQKEKSSTKTLPKSRPPSPETTKTSTSIGDKENTKENSKDKTGSKNVLANDLSNLMAAFVPQRQAAKKAAEHIKSGLSKPIVTPAELEKEAIELKDKESNNRLSSSTPVGLLPNEKSSKTTTEASEKQTSSTRSTITTTSRPITKESRTSRRSVVATKAETKVEKEQPMPVKKTKRQTSSKSESTSDSSSADSDDSDNDLSTSSSGSSSSEDDRSVKRRKDIVVKEKEKEKETIASIRNVRRRSTFQPSTPPTKILPPRRKSLFMDDRTPIIENKVPARSLKSTVVSEKDNRSLVKDLEKNSSEIAKISHKENESKTDISKENVLNLANKHLENFNSDVIKDDKVDIPIENLMISDNKENNNTKTNESQEKTKNEDAPLSNEYSEKAIPQTETLTPDLVVLNNTHNENKTKLQEITNLEQIEKIEDLPKTEKEDTVVLDQVIKTDSSKIDEKEETKSAVNSEIISKNVLEKCKESVEVLPDNNLSSPKPKENEIASASPQNENQNVSSPSEDELKTPMSPIIEIPPTPRLPVPTELDPHPSNLTVENMDIEEIDNGKIIVNDSIIEMTKKYSAMEKEMELMKEKPATPASILDIKEGSKVVNEKWPITNSEIIEVIDSSESAQSIKSITGTSNKTDDNLKEIPEIDDIEPTNNFNSFVRRKSIDREDLYAIDEDNLNFGEDNQNGIKKTTFAEEDFINSTSGNEHVINNSENKVIESVLNNDTEQIIKSKTGENVYELPDTQNKFSENIFDADLIELPPPTPSIFNDENVDNLIVPATNKEEDNARETMNLVEKLRQQKNKRAAGNKVIGTDVQADITPTIDSMTSNTNLNNQTNAQKEDSNIQLHNFQLPSDQIHKHPDTNTIVPNRKDTLPSSLSQSSEFSSDIYNSFSNNNSNNNTNQTQNISNNMVLNNQISMASFCGGTPDQNSFQKSVEQSPINPSPIGPHTPMGPSPLSTHGAQTPLGSHTPLGPQTPMGPQTPHSQHTPQTPLGPHTPHTPHGPSPHGPHTPMGPSPLGPHTPQTPLNPPSTPSSIICPSSQDQQHSIISPNARADKNRQQQHSSQRNKSLSDTTNECFDSLSTSTFFKNRDFVDMHQQITKDSGSLRSISSINNDKEHNRSLPDCEYDDSSRMQSPFNMHPQNIWNENNLIQTRRSVSTSPSSISESNDGTEQHKLINRDITCNKSQQPTVLQNALCNQQAVESNMVKNQPNFSTALQQQAHFDMTQQYQIPPQSQQSSSMSMNGPDMMSSYNYQESNQFNDNSVSMYPTHPSQQQAQNQQMNNQMAFTSPGSVNNPSIFSQQMRQYTPPNPNQNAPASIFGPTNVVGNASNHLHQKQQTQNMLTSPPVHIDSTSPFHMNQQSCVVPNASTNQNNAGANAFSSSGANMVLNAALVSTQSLMSQNQQQAQQQPNYVGLPGNMGSLVNHISQNQMLNSCDQNKSNISPMGPAIGHQSPTKPPSRNSCNTAGRHFTQNQLKSPQMHRSPGKSPRQMELLNKQNSNNVTNKQLKQMGQDMDRPQERVRKPRGRGTGAGRPRGRGRGRGNNSNRLIPVPPQIPHALVHEFEGPLVGSIQNNLAGTVYDLDFDEDFRSNVESSIKSLRDRRRSFDCRNQNQVNSNQDSLKFNSPAFGNKMRNSVNTRLLPELKPQPSNQTSSIDSALNTTSSLHIHPVLPGPVDMRTYNSGFESHNTLSSSQDSYNSSHNLLREFATGTADHPLPEIDEEDEKEFQSALRASTTVKIKPSSPQLHQQHLQEQSLQDQHMQERRLQEMQLQERHLQERQLQEQQMQERELQERLIQERLLKEQEEKEKQKETEAEDRRQKERQRREDEEKRLLQQDQQSLSNASTTDNPTPTPMVSNTLSTVSSDLQISMETTSEEISIDSDTMTVKQSLSDSRNQLKLKIKGPLAHAVSYNSSSVSSSHTQTVQSQSESLPLNQPSLTSSGSGGGSIRRMRKKELLRQYVYQDMNQEDSVGLPGTADNTLSFGLDQSKIELPKQSNDSILSSLINKDDDSLKSRKKTPGCGRELRQLETKNYDLEQRSSERRRSSACSSGSNSDLNIKNSTKRRSKSKQSDGIVQNPTSGVSNDLIDHHVVEEHDAPLKIKIRNNAVEPATSFPPKKRRISASNFPVPSFELLKRDSMMFRKQIMASYGDPEDNPQVVQKVKSHKVKSKDKDRDREKKKKHKDKDKEKYHHHHYHHQFQDHQIQQQHDEIEVKQTMPTKLIIKLKRRTDDDQLSLGGTTTDGNESTTFSVRSASPLPSCSSNNSQMGDVNKSNITATSGSGSGIGRLKLKISKKSDGYVIGDEIYSKNSSNKDSYNYSSTNPAKKSKSSTKSSSSKNRSSSTNSSKSSLSSMLQITNENSNSCSITTNNKNELIDNKKIPVVVLTQTPIPASAVAKLHYSRSRSHSRTSTPDSIRSSASLISSLAAGTATIPFNSGNDNIDDNGNNDDIIGGDDGVSIGGRSRDYNIGNDNNGAIINSLTSTPIDKNFIEPNNDSRSHMNLEDSNNSTNSMNQPLIITKNNELSTSSTIDNTISNLNLNLTSTIATTTATEQQQLISTTTETTTSITMLETTSVIRENTNITGGGNISNSILNSDNNNSNNNLISNTTLGLSNNNDNILPFNKDCEIR